MMKLIYIILVILGITSCYKENPLPVRNKVTQITENDTVVELIPTLVGQKWIIKQIRIGEFGLMENVNDTLIFLTNKTYTYGGLKSNYSLYNTGNSFNLTINGTPWGYLSGTIYSNNLLTGTIKGSKFVDITPGSSNKTNYYIWMLKI